ncbi:hypothetical protein [Streptomyces sp. NPDC055287]
MADEQSSPRRGSVTDWISVVVAAVALVVSLVSWRESHRANEEAREANGETQRLVTREQASGIDFIREQGEGGEVLSIANRSRSLIQDVIVTSADGSYIDVGAVGGCTVWWVSPLRVTNADGETVTLKGRARLDFTDAQDPPGRWTIMGDGLRSQVSEPNKRRDVKAAFGAQIKFGPVDGCG